MGAASGAKVDGPGGDPNAPGAVLDGLWAPLNAVKVRKKSVKQCPEPVKR